MEHMNDASTPEVEALIARYDRRVARVSRRGRALGYLQAYDGSALEVPARWWRDRKPREPRLAWLFEWTDAAMQQNGYSDEAGDADHDQIGEVVADWEAGRHELGDEWLQLSWLEPEEGTRISDRYFGI
jgi:hypothetical protein